MKTEKTIMVIEDDPFLRDTICGVLEEAGHRTVAMEDGAKAINYLSGAKEKPDVILLDLFMPGMDGWQFRETQLLVADTALIPVVVMTSSRNLRNISADAVIFKPFDPGQLLDVIARQTEAIEANGEESMESHDDFDLSSVTGSALAHTENRFAKNHEQDLMDHANDMDQTVRMHDRFLKMVCRELKDPINTIKSLTESIEPGCDPAQMKSTTEHIGRVAAWLQHLISQLSDSVETRVGQRFPIDSAPFDLAELFRENVDRYRDTLIGNIEVVSHGDTSGTWDRQRLTNLVTSLVIHGSGQVTSDFEQTVLIEGSSETTVDVVVSVGRSIPERLVPILLDPLHSVTEADSPTPGGDQLGLGMFLARQIVLAHGGKFSMMTSDTRGTEVTIQLPRHAKSSHKPSVSKFPLAAGR